MACQRPISSLNEGMLSWNKRAPFDVRATHRSLACCEDQARIWIDFRRVMMPAGRAHFLAQFRRYTRLLREVESLVKTIVAEFPAGIVLNKQGDLAGGSALGSLGGTARPDPPQNGAVSVAVPGRKGRNSPGSAW